MIQRFTSLVLTLIFLCITANAQIDEKIIVHLKNGEQKEYLLDEVEFVEIVSNNNASGDIVEGIGGTIPEAVDMGLSVMWADHNLGASFPADAGGYFPWDAEETSLWGDGWRLPTDEEWQELYDKCRWTWTIRDGIGGRVITGPNGNSIFVPASGIDIDGEKLVNGCIGIYWTADASEIGDGAQPVKATGTYFDSANIYRIDYPTDNKLNIRMVKPLK